MAKLGNYSVMDLGQELKVACRPYGLKIKKSVERLGVYYINDPELVFDAFDIWEIVQDAIDDCDAHYEYHGSYLAVLEEPSDAK